MKVLLALSGGADSMYLLARASELLGPECAFAVVHCNFSLRGAESDGDEDFVRKAALERGLEFFCTRFDTVSYARSKGISIEMAARELRYSYFKELTLKHSYDAVAVAHNADDNAETTIANLTRGCGLKGLCGMKSDCVIDGLRILRPMLGIPREQIESYLESNSLPHREDSTNALDEAQRNIIRHKVIPVLKELNPSFLQTLSRDQDHLRQANDIFEDYTSSFLDNCSYREPATIPIKELLALKHPRPVLWEFLSRYGFSEPTFDALCNLLRSGRTISGKTFEAPLYVLETTSDRLVVRERGRDDGPAGDVTIKEEGVYEFEGRRIEMRVLARKEIESVKAPSGTVYLDRRKAGLPLVLRSARAGDFLVPIGLKGRKKLSDIYGELGYSAQQKRQAPVVVRPGDEGSRVLCAFPTRTDESVRIETNADTNEEVIVLKEL